MEKLRFEDMNLSKEVQKGICDMGFEEMSPIQSQAIPVILEGRDIIGQAQTGTGKTAAFGIPIIERCDPNGNYVQALVLCPTRELSIQVAEEIGKLAKYKKGISVVPIYGGQPIDRQIKALKKGVNIVIGTPGRVLDHIRRRTLKIDNVSMMVLDEADEMFDMGFRDDIALVMNDLKEERQTIFFSATMPPEIMKFAASYQANPEIIKVVHKELTVPKVEQVYFELKQHMKTEILSRLVDMYNPKLTVVFCNTKKKVDELTEELQGRGYFADGLHGDLKQNQRDTVMGKFRKGTIDILIATDVAARGIDVDDVDLVINYDMPQDEEYYVHRIGRTARAGREGKAFSFVAGRDIYKLRDIQRYTKTKITRMDLPTLKDIEANYTTIMLGKIKEEIDKEDLSKYEKIIETLLEEDYTSFDIAAALLKFYMAENRLDGHEELDMVDFGGKLKGGKPTGGKPTGFKSSGSSTRIHINIGKKKGISPRHILAAIVQETGITKNLVGNIDVYDKFTFVEIPGDYTEDVLEILNGVRIKGTKVKAEIANPKRK
ncbi:ATP-dependent RNA helicase [Tissierella sp. P1]|jgi:ATP-dependent RNA helicase DeaD|uniref:DEAD/DEAH box helicase n=1 Tax=Tissierella sp. P1 TaxID=1280483 RepID=UPI000BA0979E|nr:DEAD/DEAH box helicase [Tissierella sp. P1]MDU5081122.1 DEAD/DEAH box helicase [Bacillota bacterium]OZV11112.1 ATP-dependent RNA helicase [Tissierella sp. P1]